MPQYSHYRSPLTSVLPEFELLTHKLRAPPALSQPGTPCQFLRAVPHHRVCASAPPRTSDGQPRTTACYNQRRTRLS